jgi:hypothetical protein
VTSDPVEQTSAATSPAEAWLSVCDELLWAFNHALSNRLAALTSITRILEYSDTGLDPLLSALSSEIGSLEKTLALLRLLPRSPTAVHEPVRLEDLLPEVVSLHRLQTEFRDLDYGIDAQPDTTPIWVEPSRLTHTLLLLLAAASGVACRNGGSAVAIGYTGDDRYVRLVIGTPPSTEGPGPSDSPQVDGPPLKGEVVRELVVRLGGELVEASCGDDPRSGVRFELLLPTLLSVRAREREGDR